MTCLKLTAVSPLPKAPTLRAVLILTVLFALGLTSCMSTPVVESSGSAPAPSDPIAAVCDNMIAGPATPPAGAVVVDPAVDSDLTDKTQANPPETTFWLAPGTHTLGTDKFGQVIPKDGNTYLGAPGAVLDGRGKNMFAFTQQAAEVSVRYLTIQGFVAPHDQGVINHDSGNGWVIEHNTVEHNKGAAMMAGAHQVVRGNCLRNNGQYGVNAYQLGNGITDLAVVGNEIVGNNTDDWETRVPGCGCTGGIKFWSVDGAIVRDNWIHDNHGAGLWADMNNNSFLIEDNLIDGNDGEAIFYEASYNAVIRDNFIRENAVATGKQFAANGDTFPMAAIYLSEAGGESRIPARTDKIEVHDNVLYNNWSGITVWENADRFCNSPANPSGDCTRLVSDPQQCSEPAIASPPLYDDCRWKTQHVDIHDNRFVFDPGAVGCTNGLCGRMAILSNYGTYPNWSPYQGTVVQEAITFRQGNRWHDNSYVGPWTFIASDTSQVLDTAQWQASPYQQDRGSTFATEGAR
jgi:nitrous oxidase accessory protein NosD